MTKLGLYLQSKSVNKSKVARKTGLSKARISQLCLNDKTRLEARELYLIFLAINENPGEQFEQFFKNLKLKEE